jgi:hypothetical protein
MSFSTDPDAVFFDAVQKGYNRVRFQEGRAVLDRELNLVGDLAGPERLAQSYLGDGIPDASTGFRITGLNVGANDFTITAGRALVGGREVVLLADTTYQQQPNKANVLQQLPAGVSSISLHTFTRLVTEAEDAALGNAGDVGTVTALREKVEWEVVVTPGNQILAGHTRLADLDTGTQTVTDRRRTELHLTLLRDEVTEARGNQARLAMRLTASLDQTGALKPNTVSNTQLANNSVDANKLMPNSVDANKLVNNSVTTNKIADLNVTTQKLAANAVQEPNLADNAISKRTIQDNAVSITELSKTLFPEAQVSVPAAPGAGQFGETTVNIQSLDGPAFYLISVRQVAPRPNAAFQVFQVRWLHQVVASKFLLQTPYIHTHQILFQNPNTSQAITVAYKVYRIDET